MTNSDAPFRHDVTLATKRQSRVVRRYISRVSRLFGERFTCMMAVLAAKRLLARKNVKASVFIGIKFTKKGWGALRKFEAHSWLIHDDCVVVGDRDLESFRIIKRFD